MELNMHLRNALSFPDPVLTLRTYLGNLHGQYD